MSRLNRNKPETPPVEESRLISDVNQNTDDPYAEQATKDYTEFQRKVDEEVKRRLEAQNADAKPLPQEPKDPTFRTYVLRSGKTAQFPIRYPDGQVVTVRFENGMKELSGRLSNLFHAEYMANPNLRSKCSVVDPEVADNVAKQHIKTQGRVAKPGLDSAKMSPATKESMIQEAQLRHMQRRASEGSVEQVTLPHDLKTELES